MVDLGSQYLKIKKEIDPVTGQEMTVTVLKPGGPLYNRNI